MSDKFPLESDAFTGGGRLTAQQASEGRDGAPLYSLLNVLGQSAESSEALAASLDLSAATAEQVADRNRSLVTNSGAPRTLTLPDFASAPDGWEITALAFDGNLNTFTVSRAGADTINGGDTTVALGAADAWVKVVKIPGASEWTAFRGA